VGKWPIKYGSNSAIGFKKWQIHKKIGKINVKILKIVLK
jgi:hypothetical protein